MAEINTMLKIKYASVKFLLKREKEEDNIVIYNFSMFSSSSNTEEVLKKVPGLNILKNLVTDH